MCVEVIVCYISVVFLRHSVISSRKNDGKPFRVNRPTTLNFLLLKLLHLYGTTRHVMVWNCIIKAHSNTDARKMSFSNHVVDIWNSYYYQKQLFVATVYLFLNAGWQISILISLCVIISGFIHVFTMVSVVFVILSSNKLVNWTDDCIRYWSLSETRLLCSQQYKKVVQQDKCVFQQLNWQVVGDKVHIFI